MSDGVVLDLYAEDLEKDFSQQNPDKFNDDGVDLYDDISVPTDVSSATPGQAVGDNGTSTLPIDAVNSTTKGIYQSGGTPNHVGRRYQFYVGNLTWWTTDQDIANAVRDCGINDFQEVKFFENRSNGQSKGFCVVTLGSEASLRMALERLPKKELHSQVPAVTHPTKQALNHFESLQKTRPIPPTQTNCPMRGPAPMNMGVPGAMVSHVQPQGVMAGNPQRMMNPNMPPQQYRPPHMQQDSPIGPNGGPPRMQPPMHQNSMMGPQGQPMPPGPPRYPNNQPQWQNVQGGQPRSNGPRAGPPNGPMPRAQMFQGAPGGMGIRGPRPDWSRPPMHANYGPQGPPGVPPQGPPHMQGPPRAPGGPPNMVGPPTGGPGGVPNPHVNPAFFNQPVGGPSPHPLGPPMQGPHGPRVGMPPQHFQQGNPPRGPWPVPPQAGKPPMAFPEVAPLTEAEFEEIMSRNRTVSSSAIARAVSDAATGEYSSAIETLATAISLIKQSKVAHDERCKILISSLQDTLHGIEAKSYNRREHSRSRERAHRTRPRRDRSSSRYRERSRERERDRERDRSDREGGYRERSRSRERPDHYRDDSSSRSTRPRKSPEAVERSSDAPPSKRGYYEERYRSSDRERDRERDRNRDRDRERDRDRDQDRDREHERERERRH